MHEGRFARIAGPLLVALLFGACGSDNKESVWEAPLELLPPTIVSFDAGPERITVGGSTVLGWRSRNAESLTLVDGTGGNISIGHLPVELGSISVEPTESTSYTLTATGSDGTFTSRTVTVLVQDEPPVPPAVERFAATPEVIAVGSRVTLSWKTTGAHSVSIKDDAGVEVDLGSAIAEGQVSVKPTRSPTVYALTASGPGGRATAQASVTVTGQPRVVRFDVSPLEPIDVGGKVTLTWETSNATRVIIKMGDQPFLDSVTRLSGSEQIELSESAAFTLEATSATGAAGARAEARVGPRILAFSPSERLARYGEAVTFGWKLDGADRATIDGPGDCHVEVDDLDSADEASGSGSCRVTEPGDYVLRAFRGSVSRTAAVRIDLTAAPRIRHLSVDPPVVTAAADRPAEVKLSWRQSGAARCTIYVNGQHLTDLDCGDTGSVNVPVTASSLIRLEVVNDDGNHASMVSVDAVEPARIVSFAAVPDRLLGPGDPVTLKWNVTDAVSVSMERNDVTFEIEDDVFDVDALDIRAPDLVGFDSYRLTAVNSLDDATHATVRVRVGAPVILVWATPDFVALGDPFDLSWLVDGGDELVVAGPGGSQLFRTDDPALIASGLTKPNAPTIAGRHPYKITATNGAGSSSAVVDVTATDGPLILSFTVDRLEISLGESVTFSWKVENDRDDNPPVLSLADDHGRNYTEIDGENPNHGSVTIRPADEIPYVFTLTASTGDDRIEARASLPIEVTTAPILSSFTASSGRVSTDGGTVTPEVTLAWQSQHAVELMLFVLDKDGVPGSSPFLWRSRLNGDAQEELDEGSIVVHPTLSTWYLARIRSRVGTVVERTLKVVVDPPEVLSFQATPSEVLEGETVELSWTIRNATSAIIDPAFEYIDISNQPFATKSDLTGDSAVTNIQFPAGFTFPFEGSDKTAIQASSNGVLGFNTSNTSSIGYSPAFPNSNGANVNFALYGCDLNPGHNAGELWYGLTADFYGPMFVVQYKNWSWQSSTYNPSSLNFELVLRPDGRFEFRYGKMTTKAGYEDQAKGKGCMIGYQGTTSSRPSELFSAFQQPLASGLAYKSFVRPNLPKKMAEVIETRTMNPLQTTTYTLTGINDEAETVAQTTVTVWKRPTLAARVIASADQSLEFSWTAAGANGVRVLDAVGQPICLVTDPTKVAAGSCTHVEETTGPKTFIVEAVSGPLEAPLATTAVSLDVVVYANLEIGSFTVAPKQFVNAGDQVTLSWTTLGAYEIHLRACPLGAPDPMKCDEVMPHATIPATGSAIYEMEISSEFWLVAFDTQYRSVKAMQNVWVGAGEITRFDASSTQILAGESTTLTWNSTDKVTATLTPRVPGFYEVTNAPFVDIADGATIVNRAGGSADAGYYDVEFPSGFAFPWFGEWKKRLRASTDGWITFNMDYTSTHAAAQNLPSPASFKAVQLAPFWVNLNQGTGSLRSKLVEPPAGERHLVIEWHGFKYHLASFGTYSNLNFQVVLFESGTVDFRYGTMESRSGTELEPLPVPGDYADGPKGYSACMGWQDPDMTQGGMLVNPRGAMEGGLAGRSWRFPIQLSPNGSISVSPAVSTTYKLCATNPTSGYVECRAVRVLVIQPGDLLFSELMIETAPQEAEWLELRNMSPDEIDLGGWRLSSGGKEYTILSSVKVKPDGYAVFARSGEPTVNGGLVGPHVYGDAILLDDTTGDVTLSMGSLEIDRVAWNNTWPIQANKSIAVEPTLMTRAPACNDLPTAWCATTAPYGDGTFGGSPGTAGDGCLAAP